MSLRIIFTTFTLNRYITINIFLFFYFFSLYSFIQLIIIIIYLPVLNGNFFEIIIIKYMLP